MYEVDVCGLCHIVTFLEDSFLESMWTQRGAQGSGRQEISSVRTEEPRVTKPPSPYLQLPSMLWFKGLFKAIFSQSLKGEV